MARYEFEGRSAAEAAIKACEKLGLTRSELRYDVISESGDGLDRAVVIAVEGDAKPLPARTDDDGGRDSGGEREERDESRGDGERDRDRDRSRGRGRRDGRNGRGGGRGGRSGGGRGRRDARGGRSGGRGGRGGGGGRSRRDGGPRERDDGIEALLNLEVVPAEPVELRPELEGAGSELAEAAKKVLGELFEHCGWTVTVHRVKDDEEEIHLDLRSEDPARLIGNKGEVLLSLQFLVNRMVSRSFEGEQVVVLDVAAYRERRRDALADLANRLAKRAMEEGKVVRLSPMSAHDRRVFHLTLTESEGVTTRSEGTGLYRNLLIIPSEYAAEG